ncbi:phosphoribosyl-ATP pyrophosphohydrolase [Thalassobacillus hwangdonensis]|uniref:Phosphoribosyl-ATP pyrophosphohydrolase n=1 Tax=Thalassobacillus hwangdonensis TaxID=546108 RepID=A0ABW3L572_9BACI
MPIYNKLVRDRIPEIIIQNGKILQTRRLSTLEYQTELRKKLLEEVDEYLDVNENKAAVEELADIMELVSALAKQHDSSIEEVEKVRKKKAQERGAFNDQVFLESVED